MVFSWHFPLRRPIPFRHFCRTHKPHRTTTTWLSRGIWGLRGRNFWRICCKSRGLTFSTTTIAEWWFLTAKNRTFTRVGRGVGARLRFCVRIFSKKWRQGNSKRWSFAPPERWCRPPRQCKAKASHPLLILFIFLPKINNKTFVVWNWREFVLQ